MSIYGPLTPVASFPAYNVFERAPRVSGDHAGFVNITAADVLALDSGRGFHRTYNPGSCASYALEYNECPIASYNRAIERGHPTHWISARGSVLTDHARAAEDVILVRPGMRVVFEGRRFTIELAANHNLRLAAVAETVPA